MQQMKSPPSRKRSSVFLPYIQNWLVIDMQMRSIQLKMIVIGLFFACALGSVPRAAVAMSLQEEIDLGKKIDVEIMKESKLYADDKAQKEIQEYGQNLAKFVKRPQIPYHFKILNDKEFNAFSIPGGYVYFTSRLWEVLRPDERIGVVGHEIIHVDNRHAIDALSKRQTRQTVLAVILAATKAGNIWGNVAGITEQLYSLKFSRSDEKEADYGAVDLCQKAKYKPAGILLSMYKIKRFEDESGGAPPKLLSDHPPSKERQQYLQQLLASKGIAVPAEDVKTVNMPDRIGAVTSAASDKVSFSSTKAVEPGDIVWVMREGWDSRYENRTAVPAARAVITQTGANISADIQLIPSEKNTQIKNGMAVYAPPIPPVDNGIGYVAASSSNASLGQTKFVSTQPKALDRYMTIQAVWNKDKTQLVNENVGYVVITDPSSSTGYVGVQRSAYSYAPFQLNSTLVKISDPNEPQWIGPIISIGRRGGTIEIKPTRALAQSKTYDVLYPAWGKDDTYEKRIVGTAKLESISPKIVLKMTNFTGGWSVSGLQNGFDVYEQKQASK